MDLLHDLFRTTTLRLQPSLAEDGITIGQFWAMHTISELSAGSLGTVARQLGVSPPTVCANIDTLETAGLVRRTRSEKDRRAVELSLTPRGRRVEARVWKDLTRYMTEASDEVSEKDLRAAVRVFREIASRLQPNTIPSGRIR